MGENKMEIFLRFLRTKQAWRTRLFECLRVIRKYVLSLLFH